MSFKNIFNKIKQNHLLMMIICCAIPLIIAGILFYLGFKKYAIFAVMLLCPVLHYLMMRDMRKGNNDEKSVKNKERNKEGENKKCH